MRKLTLPADLQANAVNELIPRANVTIASVTEAVESLIEEVRSEPLTALRDHALRFDGVTPESFRVPVAELTKALAGLEPELRVAIEEAISRVRKVSEATLPKDSKTLLA